MWSSQRPAVGSSDWLDGWCGNTKSAALGLSCDGKQIESWLRWFRKRRWLLAAAAYGEDDRNGDRCWNADQDRKNKCDDDEVRSNQLRKTGDKGARHLTRRSFSDRSQGWS